MIMKKRKTLLNLIVLQFTLSLVGAILAVACIIKIVTICINYF